MTAGAPAGAERTAGVRLAASVGDGRSGHVGGGRCRGAGRYLRDDWDRAVW